MNPRPTLTSDFTALSSEPAVRHEELLDCFGQHLFWCRSQAQSFIQQAISSPELRQRLGRIPAQPFARVADLPESAQEAAVELARASTDHFIQLLLAVFTSSGADNRFGPDHAVRYKLFMEIIQKDDHEHALHDELLNRGGQKAFFAYFGRWLRQHHTPTEVA